ncbi:M48 family metallopeptidase [bacterium]|nr:M48 family metallopeptidase [bacterium]
MNVSANLIDKLRDPKEKTALTWLLVCSIPIWIMFVAWTIISIGGFLLIVGFIVLIRFLAELFAVAYIKSNAIEVSENQIPGVYEAARVCCEKLGSNQPAVYVMQDGLWNAFAMKLAGRRIVVLLSGAIDSLLLKGDMRQVTWLIGHEIGHHAAGHLDFLSKTAEFGAWLPWLLLWYKRRCELTCDRIGLYCTGDPTACLTALANLSVGAQLAPCVNINEAIAQWHRHQHEVYVRYRTIYSTHPPHLWRMEEMAKAAAVMGMFASASNNSPASDRQPPTA